MTVILQFLYNIVFYSPHLVVFGYILYRLYKSIYNRDTGDVRSWRDDAPDSTPKAAPGNRYPFSPFPAGWFRVAESNTLKPGDVKPLRYFGKDLVLYRGHDGVARVFDAFCPHLGAHLGYGGKVTAGNCIQCPFHAWRYNPEGECVSIPYSNSIPKQAKLSKWPCQEKNEIIWVYNNGDPPNTNGPAFDFPVVKEVGDPNWQLLHVRWTVRVHQQEVTENSVDIGHFNVVHAYDTKPDIVDFSVKDHIFSIKMQTKRTLLNVWQSVSDLEITYHGMGVVLAKARADFLQTSVIFTSIPIDEEYCEVNIYVRFKKTWCPPYNWFISWYVPYHLGQDFYADLPIWENKIYQMNPVFCKGDGPMMAVRRWSKQFYGSTVKPVCVEDDEAEENGKTESMVITKTGLSW